MKKKYSWQYTDSSRTEKFYFNIFNQLLYCDDYSILYKIINIENKTGIKLCDVNKTTANILNNSLSFKKIKRLPVSSEPELEKNKKYQYVIKYIKDKLNIY